MDTPVWLINLYGKIIEKRTNFYNNVLFNPKSLIARILMWPIYILFMYTGYPFALELDSITMFERIKRVYSNERDITVYFYYYLVLSDSNMRRLTSYGIEKFTIVTTNGIYEYDIPNGIVKAGSRFIQLGTRIISTVNKTSMKIQKSTVILVTIIIAVIVFGEYLQRVN